MPIYEYRCHQCGKTFEVIQKFSDQPLAVHEDCGGELERLISPSAFQFKGSGWYVTDYGNGKSKPPANATPEMKDAMKEGKVDAPKTDAKPAASSTPSPSPSSSSSSSSSEK